MNRSKQRLNKQLFASRNFIPETNSLKTKKITEVILHLKAIKTTACKTWQVTEGQNVKRLVVVD